MAVKIISQSISTKLWDRAAIKLATPGSAVRLVTDCAMSPVAWDSSFIVYIEGSQVIISNLN